MSGKWDGFTEEDIKNINVGGSKGVGPQKSPLRAAKLGSSLSNHRQQVKNNVREKVIKENLLDVIEPTLIQPNQKMDSQGISTSTVDPMTRKPSIETDSGNISISNELILLSQEKGKAEFVEASRPDMVPINSATSISPVCIRVKEDRSYEVIGSQKMSLEEFQAKQKLMEEQNRHRKELLGKALADRKKQTNAESQRLQQIQEELQKLDSLLSNDVSILRNQIEVASLEFSDAQKRYIKAEKEFLEAKIIMFGKLEQKELLTEHLCTIIEQNELRKARKLSELMHKLELGIVTEFNKEEKITPPSVCFMNDISDLPSNITASNNHTEELQTEESKTTEPLHNGTDI